VPKAHYFINSIQDQGSKCGVEKTRSVSRAGGTLLTGYNSFPDFCGWRRTFVDEYQDFLIKNGLTVEKHYFFNNE
jgi:hypothetical protein